MVAMNSYAFDTSLKSRILTNLQTFELLDVDSSQLRSAAVAIVVTPHPDTQEAAFLITLRSSKLKRHSGQYALPGGRLDEGETLKDAALRETREELGLDLTKSDVLGRLDDMPTRSGFAITPFVLWRPPGHTLRPDPSEVETVFHVPLSELDSAEIPQLEREDGVEALVMSAPLATLGHQVYAPTAAMLYQFREVGLHGRGTRVSHYEQPRFAWS